MIDYGKNKDRKYFEYTLSTFTDQETRDIATKWYNKYPKYYIFLFKSLKLWPNVMLIALFCHFLNISIGTLLISTVMFLILLLLSGIYVAYKCIKDEVEKDSSQ